MISPFDDQFELILASKSPRRQALVSNMFVNFDVIDSDVEELLPDGLEVEQTAEYLARLKSTVNIALEPYQVLLTADTVVIFDGKVLGKPKNIEEAKEMLHKLSSNTHTVITGVNLRSQQSSHSFSEKTEVTFYPLSDEEIEFYVTNFEVLDKAGGYGIQDWIGLVAVKEIIGDYYNIVGLPMPRLVQELKLFYEKNTK